MATYPLAVPSIPYAQNGRRSANFQPPICDDDFIQSLKSDYGEQRYTRRAENLKNYAIKLLDEENDTFTILEIIDTLERLGVSYHFDEGIKQVINDKLVDARKVDDLHFTALRFRILRQHGHLISQDEFIPFLDKGGGFKEALSKDTKAILSLYDASYLAMEEERILDVARDFTTRHLRDHLQRNIINSALYKLVERGLELPYYWRPPRLEARWFVDVYDRMENKNPKLLEFAKLDYNICQARYQNSIKSMSRWWKDRGLAYYLPFSRDRLPECFLWGLGIVSRPQYGHATEGITIISQLITIMDDIYDVYATIEELELFTNAIERWDVQALEVLPDYMKIYYLVFFNFVHEMGYTTLKQQGCNIIPFLKKMWGDLSKAYLVEAKWSYEGYRPTFAEYINNAWISIAAPVVLPSAFFLMNQELNEERLALLHYPDLIQNQSVAIRLLDDLGSSSDEQERGDMLKAVYCYMCEKGVSQEAGCEHAKYMISESWKKMNKYLIFGASFPRDFVITVMDAVRKAHWFYMCGDGFTSQRTKTLHAFKSLVVEPIDMVSEHDEMIL